jgi:transcriptional regulator with XRE-family HTH domain
VTEIGPKLRSLIIRTRKQPGRWGKTKGLSQQALAARAGTSAVWLRQIETGYTHTASPEVLAGISLALDFQPAQLRDMGYDDVADAMELQANITPQHLTGLDVQDDERAIEKHIREIPALSSAEQDILVDTFREIRRLEPLGRDMWRRRRREA